MELVRPRSTTSTRNRKPRPQAPSSVPPELETLHLPRPPTHNPAFGSKQANLPSLLPPGAIEEDIIERTWEDEGDDYFSSPTNSTAENDANFLRPRTRSCDEMALLEQTMSVGEISFRTVSTFDEADILPVPMTSPSAPPHETVAQYSMANPPPFVLENSDEAEGRTTVNSALKRPPLVNSKLPGTTLRTESGDVLRGLSQSLAHPPNLLSASPNPPPFVLEDSEEADGITTGISVLTRLPTGDVMCPGTFVSVENVDVARGCSRSPSHPENGLSETRKTRSRSRTRRNDISILRFGGEEKRSSSLPPRAAQHDRGRGKVRVRSQSPVVSMRTNRSKCTDGISDTTEYRQDRYRTDRDREGESNNSLETWETGNSHNEGNKEEPLSCAPMPLSIHDHNVEASLIASSDDGKSRRQHRKVGLWKKEVSIMERLFGDVASRERRVQGRHPELRSANIFDLKLATDSSVRESEATTPLQVEQSPTMHEEGEEDDGNKENERKEEVEETGESGNENIALKEEKRDDVYSRILLPSSIYHNSNSSLWIVTIDTNVPNKKKSSKTQTDHLKAFSFPTETEAHEAALAYSPPHMIPFDTESRCRICKSKFAMFRRAGHCRNCGVCVCHNCAVHWSVKRVPDTYNYKRSSKVKVCKECDMASDKFRQALVAGDVEEVIRLYQHGNMNLRCCLGKFTNGEVVFPIHAAAMGGSLPLLKWLVDDHYSPIFLTRTGNNITKAGGSNKESDPSGSNQPLLTSKGRSVLHIAMARNDVAMLRYLVVDKGMSLYEAKDLRVALSCLHGALGRMRTDNEDDEEDNRRYGGNDVDEREDSGRICSAIEGNHPQADSVVTNRSFSHIFGHSDDGKVSNSVSIDDDKISKCVDVGHGSTSKGNTSSYTDDEDGNTSKANASEDSDDDDGNAPKGVDDGNAPRGVNVDDGNISTGVDVDGSNTLKGVDFADEKISKVMDLNDGNITKGMHIDDGIHEAPPRVGDNGAAGHLDHAARKTGGGGLEGVEAIMQQLRQYNSPANEKELDDDSDEEHEGRENSGEEYGDDETVTTVADACIICYENSIDCVMAPCGHQICCLQCSSNINVCPVCNTECTFIRIFKL